MKKIILTGLVIISLTSCYYESAKGLRYKKMSDSCDVISDYYSNMSNTGTLDNQKAMIDSAIIYNSKAILYNKLEAIERNK